MSISPNPLLRPALLSLALAALLATSADAPAQRRNTPNPDVPVACSDFYSFTNRDWLAANTVQGSGSITALGQLRDNALLQQQELLNRAAQAPQNPVQQLLGDFWASGLDEAAVETAGAGPIASLLSHIDAIRRARDIAPAITALHQVGIPVAFSFTADVDLNNLNQYIGYFSPGGLGLPDPAYYIRQDDDTRRLLEEYRIYVRNILALTGVAEAQLDAEAVAVIDLETRIAQQSPAIQTISDPRHNYALVPVAGLNRQYGRLQLQEFLQAQGVEAEQVSLAHTAVFTQLDDLVNRARPAQWKSYLRFHVGNAMAPYLSNSFRTAEFEFHGRVLRGEAEQSPWRNQVLDAINHAAGQMVAREYVAAHLPEPSRTRALEIAEDIRRTLQRNLDANTWLSESAKNEARNKLERLQIEIGAPAQALDFSVQPMGRGSFGGNMLIASTWKQRETMRLIGQSTADQRWPVVPQEPVLAYDPGQNRLIITAASLQAPIFDVNEGPAGQYASFGALVAHQLGSSIDRRGSVIDAEGNIRTWWDPSDIAQWDERANRLAAQYNQYPYPAAEGSYVNGARTRDANIADLASLELAWDAFATSVGGSPVRDIAEPFFQAWAHLWRQQTSADVAMVNAASSPYAPGQWRTNGTLNNLEAFGELYTCRVGSNMRRPVAEQVSIWR